jgi:hypothetical protein
MELTLPKMLSGANDLRKEIQELLRKQKLCPKKLCHLRGSPHGFQSNFGPIQERDK